MLCIQRQQIALLLCTSILFIELNLIFPSFSVIFYSALFENTNPECYLRGKRWSSPILTTEHWAQSWSRCTAHMSKSSTWRQAVITFSQGLPSQPKSVTAHWPVPNYTAWYQRQMGVNNLPKVVTQQCGSWGLNSRPLSHQSHALATRLSSHPCISFFFYLFLDARTRGWPNISWTEIVEKGCCAWRLHK